jgi:conjugative transposon protein TcpC
MEARSAKAELGARAAVTRYRLDARWARWRSRLPRFALMGVVLILSLVGLRDLIAPAEPVRASRGHPAVDPAADDFALQFARAYLSYDAAKPERRERALAAFLPSSLDPDGGFTPAAGSQSVLWAEVASNQPALAGGRVITVAAQTSSQEQPVYLAITVRHDSGRPLELVDYPSFVGAPSVAREPHTVERGSVEDPAVVEVTGRVVRNYLAGQVANLDADLTPGAVVTVPTIALRVASVDQVVWTGQGSNSGAVLVSVTAVDVSGGTYRLTYELGVVLRERPYVDFVQVIPTDT